MKNILFTLSIIPFLLTGCGGGSDGATSTTPVSTQPKKINSVTNAKGENTANLPPTTSSIPATSNKPTTISPSPIGIPPVISKPTSKVTLQDERDEKTHLVSENLPTLFRLIEEEKDKNNKLKRQENSKYILGYGIDIGNNQHTFYFQDRKFSLNDEYINLKEEITAKNANYLQIATALEKNQSFVINYDNHSFLGVDKHKIIAFGFQTAKDITHINLYYFGSAILHFNDMSNPNKYLIAGFHGHLSDNQFSGEIVAPLDENNQYGVLRIGMYANGRNTHSAIFDGAAVVYKEINDQRIKYHNANIKVQFNGKEAEGVSGIIYGSNIVGGGFVGTQDPVSNKELGK